MSNIAYYGELQLIGMAFYDFEFKNIYLETPTGRLKSFEIHRYADKIATVTDMRTTPTGIHVLQVDKEGKAHKPDTQKAIAKVRNAFKNYDYEYKAQSALTPLLTQGFLGAIQLLAELSYLALQFAITRDMTATHIYRSALNGGYSSEQSSQHLNSFMFCYGHVGNNAIPFGTDLLNQTTVVEVTSTAVALNTDISGYVDSVMQRAGNLNQYMAGAVTVPLTHEWGRKLTVEDVLAIYL